MERPDVSKFLLIFQSVPTTRVDQNVTPELPIHYIKVIAFPFKPEFLMFFLKVWKIENGGKKHEVWYISLVHNIPDKFSHNSTAGVPMSLFVHIHICHNVWDKDCLIIIRICCVFLLSIFMPLILSQGNFEGIFK